MTEFNNFGLAPALVDSLLRMNFTTPTPIQKQAIPLALDGRDILGSAQTGTGKTGAFAIPLINKLLEQNEGTALVLSPTRELSKQIMDAMREMIPAKSGINYALLIGGEDMRRQFDQLRRQPRLIIGTPGRVHDH
ncbi:MAG: DEAD/DEAH box helicase, partial [Pseudomonadota bacterium]|nr:DEAD/DEAH box helicase [Pseudomonadota bacterium]